MLAAGEFLYPGRKTFGEYRNLSSNFWLKYPISFGMLEFYAVQI
jgi:hypothetical protein